MTCKLTNIGQEDEVHDILSTLDCLIMQHGYLHENMHQCDCIYNEYMGALLQPLAVAALLGVKCINGDPVKSNFKDHEIFLMRIFKVLKQYRLDEFMKSVDVSLIVENG